MYGSNFYVSDVRKNHTKRIKIFLTLIMAFNPRCVWGAPNFSIMTLSSSKLNLPVSLTLNLKKIINFDFKKEISAQVICHFFYGVIQVLNRPDRPVKKKKFQQTEQVFLKKIYVIFVKTILLSNKVLTSKLIIDCLIIWCFKVSVIRLCKNFLFTNLI